MKIKTGSILQAHMVLKRLIEEQRPLASKGKYRIARLFTLLDAELRIIEEQRIILIKKYGYEVIDEETKASKGWQVSEQNMDNFQKEWSGLMEDEIEINCEPIPLSVLDSPPLVEVEVLGGDGSRSTKNVDPITIQDFLLLGDFVKED